MLLIDALIGFVDIKIIPTLAFGVAWLLRVPFHGLDTTVLEAAIHAYGFNQGTQLLVYVVVVIVYWFWGCTLLFD